MTNLYGWGMSQYLPTGDFHEIEFTKRNERNLSKTILRFPDNNNCGYLLECDLEYPFNIHEKAKHFPFLPDQKTIKVEDFSRYMRENKPKTCKPNEKLIMDQTNKQR